MRAIQTLHATEGMYSKGCRCELCRAHHAEYMRNYRDAISLRDVVRQKAKAARA